MWVRKLSAATAAPALLVAAAVWAQAQSPGSTASARVEAIPVELIPPDRYEVPLVLRSGRNDWVMAPADNVLKSINVEIGSTVREGQDIAQLDRSEALAKQEIAD